MKFDLGKKENLALALIVMVGNIAAIVLFTQIFNEYYILTLIAASTFCLLLLYAYRLMTTGKTVEEASGETATHSVLDVFKAFAPLAVGVLVVVLWKIPAISSVINGLSFKVGFWGYYAGCIGFCRWGMRFCSIRRKRCGGVRICGVFFKGIPAKPSGESPGSPEARSVERFLHPRCR